MQKIEKEIDKIERLINSLNSFGRKVPDSLRDKLGRLRRKELLRESNK